MPLNDVASAAAAEIEQSLRVACEAVCASKVEDSGEGEGEVENSGEGEVSAGQTSFTGYSDTVNASYDVSF